MLEVNDDGDSLSPYKHVYLLPKLLPNTTKHSSCRSGVSSLDTPTGREYTGRVASQSAEIMDGDRYSSVGDLGGIE